MVSKAGSLGASATSYITVADADNLSFTNGSNDLPFSISFLIKFSSYDSTDGLWVINKREDSLTPVEWQVIFIGGTFRLTINTDGLSANNIAKVLTFTPTLNQTYHCVVTYDGTENAIGINVYIDAVSGGATSVIGTYTGMSNTSSRVDIGRRGWDGVGFGTSQYRLDCLRIWDKELTQSEVNAIATDELNGIDINP